MLASRIVLAVLAVLVCAGLWVVFRPSPPAPAAAAAVAPEVTAKTFEFVLRDGKRVSGTESLRVRQGEQVTLRIESNASDELHLHGYDLKLAIRAGEPATLQFAATRSGRFGIELHKHHSELGALEVYPQ
jgi:hypothetical protein